ncbi:hypothetical protein PROFUN_11659 [Planoprotostelium fungivorum]|uniref:Uncharacterized protein n=1 Tax=Planoprotostelium fungivorum TaxID=1890364 RepID=A0A2P6N9T6_9EUKA|nr:hypothetical protein PROFUN_11659 [Planoprotostelium fungivorum]
MEELSLLSRHTLFMRLVVANITVIPVFIVLITTEIGCLREILAGNDEKKQNNTTEKVSVLLKRGSLNQILHLDSRRARPDWMNLTRYSQFLYHKSFLSSPIVNRYDTFHAGNCSMFQTVSEASKTLAPPLPLKDKVVTVDLNSCITDRVCGMNDKESEGIRRFDVDLSLCGITPARAEIEEEQEKRVDYVVWVRLQLEDVVLSLTARASSNKGDVSHFVLTAIERPQQILGSTRSCRDYFTAVSLLFYSLSILIYPLRSFSLVPSLVLTFYFFLFSPVNRDQYQQLLPPPTLLLDWIIHSIGQKVNFSQFRASFKEATAAPTPVFNPHTMKKPKIIEKKMNNTTSLASIVSDIASYSKAMQRPSRGLTHTVFMAIVANNIQKVGA